MVVVKMHVVILEPPVSSLIKKHATVSNMKTYLSAGSRENRAIPPDRVSNI
jgi:hypothetical protein